MRPGAEIQQAGALLKVTSESGIETGWYTGAHEPILTKSMRDIERHALLIGASLRAVSYPWDIPDLLDLVAFLRVNYQMLTFQIALSSREGAS